MKIKFLSLLITSFLASPTYLGAQSLYSVHQLENNNGEIIDDWIANNQAIHILLDKKPEDGLDHQSSAFKSATQFQIILGDTDISSLFEFKNDRLIFSGGISLPAGENTLIVNQFINGQWREAGTQSVSVMTSSGFKQAEWTPRLELSVNSQLAEQVSGDATESERPTYSDVTSSLGFQSHHQNDDFSIDSNLNFLFVSNRQQAIQFGNRGVDARKLDLADYSVTVNNGFNKITFGQTSYGSNSLLIDNLSRRGISWSYQNDSQLSFSGAVLNGTDIVGYQNFFGLAKHNQQYVNSLGFGFNAFTESRISLRIEGTYLDAKRLSNNNFGIGEISSAETNQGMGFKFTTTDQQGKLNADLTIGLSRYTNPDDSGLNFGEDLLALKTETAVAHNLNISYNLVENWQTPWGSDTRITLNATDSKAEPLYQTLTAYVQANVKNQSVNAQYQIGNISGSIGTQSSRDNIDNLATLLTTKTRNNSFSANLPLAQIFKGESNDSDDTSSTKNWLPALDYSYQQTHQYALNSPDEAESGFNGGSHLPDQLTTNHSVSGSWQFDAYSLSIQSSHSNQDNRQVGREEDDFSNLQHSVSFNVQQNESTAWSFSVGKNRQRDHKSGKIQFSKSATVSFNWQSMSGLALSVNYGLNKDDDSFDEAKNISTNADIGLIKNLAKGEWLLPMDGSISLRINYNDSESIDNVFDQLSQFGTKTAQLSFNFSF